MKDKLLFSLVVVVLLISGALFYFQNDIFTFYLLVTDNISEEYLEFQKVVIPTVQKSDIITLPEIEKEIIAPPPLEAVKDEVGAFLTKEGVVIWTNFHRTDSGLPLLTENQLLNQAAEEKVKDMFANQYFAHISPSGTDAGDLTESVGYLFISIGENLAQGNFKSDQSLVQGWMNSPAHKENILNDKFTEIGVAVMQGVYNGRITWMSVQEFGRPLSLCASPNQELKQEIQGNNIEIKETYKILTLKKEELETISSRNWVSYNRKANEYSQLVNRYNILIETIEILFTEYNLQTFVFNICIGQ